MAKIPKIHGARTPTRIHFIPEWAERRGVLQADIARELGVGKGTVSRWFDGFLPKEQTIPVLAEFFCGLAAWTISIFGLFYILQPSDDFLEISDVVRIWAAMPFLFIAVFIVWEWSSH